MPDELFADEIYSENGPKSPYATDESFRVFFQTGKIFQIDRNVGQREGLSVIHCAEGNGHTVESRNSIVFTIAIHGRMCESVQRLGVYQRFRKGTTGVGM